MLGLRIISYTIKNYQTKQIMRDAMMQKTIGSFSFNQEHSVLQISHPVKGRWEKKGQDICCSVCDKVSVYNWYGANLYSNYCPNCGALMMDEDETYGENGRRCENCKYGFHPKYYDENTITCIKLVGWNVKKSDWFCGDWEKRNNVNG
jgi:hypothetical protein